MLFKKSLFPVMIGLILYAIGPDVYAQDRSGEGEGKKFYEDEISLTLDEAIQIALVNNHLLRKGALDIEFADAQIREAWGSVYPQINASGEYTRNVKTVNPFLGSEAGGLFEAFGAMEWLAFNEGARTDGDPSTEPISFDDFLDRQRQGYQDAGITPPSADDNPFGVDNQFQFGVTLNQTIYNGAAFAAIRGARQFRQLSEDQAELDRQTVVDEVKTSFYTALLAKEQVDVLTASVERLRKTVEETAKAVQAGLLSKYDRVSAEVELVNIETNLLEAENQAELAAKSLALQLGIPTRIKINFLDSLEFDDRQLPDLYDTDHAYELALRQRPDLSLSEGNIGLLTIQRDITRSGYLPTVNAFANVSYIGQVPSDRVAILPVEGQDFAYRTETRDFFGSSYWDSAVAVGVRLNWNIFNGFQTRMQVQQNKIEIKQAEIDRDFHKNAIYLEVDQAIRNLNNALKRIHSQERNIEQARLNYDFSLTRLREGAGTSLEERQASSLLDQSRLNYLSAVYDFLTALSQYEKAIGKPVLENP